MAQRDRDARDVRLGSAEARNTGSQGRQRFDYWRTPDEDGRHAEPRTEHGAELCCAADENLGTATVRVVGNVTGDKFSVGEEAAVQETSAQ